MQLHELQPQTKQKTKKRVGRGGKRGKTSGKGHKGQNARAGNSGRPEMREIIKKLPKLRGFGTNRARTVNAERVRPHVINVSALDAAFDSGAEVNPKILAASGIIDAKKGTAPQVKILGDGEIKKPITISGCSVSKSAREKIEKAKGTVK